MWLHLPDVHLAMFTFSVVTTDPVWKPIWYCVMFPVTSGIGFSGFWSKREILTTVMCNVSS